MWLKKETCVDVVTSAWLKEKKEWNAQLVRQVLGPEEADLVLGIPLSLHLPQDCYIWDSNPNGKFTVRSAYKSLKEGLDRGSVGECSDGSVMKQIWRSIWGMNTPNKIRSFAWKACRGILATKENLKRRHIIVDDLCEICGKEPENYSHLFWFCDKAAEVWSHSKLVLPFQPEDRWGFINVIWQIIRHGPTNSDLLEKTMTMCWEIWKNRNVLRHGGTRKPGKLGPRTLEKGITSKKVARIGTATLGLYLSPLKAFQKNDVSVWQIAIALTLVPYSHQRTPMDHGMDFATFDEVRKLPHLQYW
ncbi:putative ribonuclease h protein [Quercus suber]|uniref:Ribonuclease h protein n=1 Tax=Quercus suber TaxID=58331 RepID=A0AAW0M3V2_QUESU